MSEVFPLEATEAQLEGTDEVHILTATYMTDLRNGTLNEFDVGEDLACKIAADEIDEDEAERISINLGIEQASFED